jgi:hypothetical protein
LQKLAVVWAKTDIIFAKLFGENILQIITSVPRCRPTNCRQNDELSTDKLSEHFQKCQLVNRHIFDVSNCCQNIYTIFTVPCNLVGRIGRVCVDHLTSWQNVMSATWLSTTFLVSDPLCLSSSLALHFSNYSFWVHRLVNWDDRQLLAHAMASDFSVIWQCLSKRTFFFVMDQTPHPSVHNLVVNVIRKNSSCIQKVLVLAQCRVLGKRPQCIFGDS